MSALQTNEAETAHESSSDQPVVEEVDPSSAGRGVPAGATAAAAAAPIQNGSEHKSAKRSENSANNLTVEDITMDMPGQTPVYCHHHPLHL